MIKIFDYIYYRLNKFYYKWDGKNGSTSAIGVTMIQMLLLFLISFFLMKIFLTKSEMLTLSKIYPKFMVVLFFILCWINERYYKTKLIYMELLWQNESKKQKRKRGLWVVLALIVPWMIIIIIGIL